MYHGVVMRQCCIIIGDGNIYNCSISVIYATSSMAPSAACCCGKLCMWVFFLTKPTQRCFVECITVTTDQVTDVRRE